MSAAAGPPPPPPPPPPNNSFASLPTELLLNVIRFLRTDDYVAFALAIYPILQFHGLVPPLTLDIYRRITQNPCICAHAKAPDQDAQGSHQRLPRWGRRRNQCLPIELNDEIMEYLEPADRIAWLFSHWEMFREYIPTLSEETKLSLWGAMQKSAK